MKDIQKPVLMNYREIEKYYGLKRSTVINLVWNKSFVPIVKVGNKNYFRTEDIDLWIQSKVTL